MTSYLEIHPDNPQPRLLAKAIAAVQEGGVIAYPTDSGYALGCALSNKSGLDRIRQIRQLSDKKHFTLMCYDFAQLGPLVILSNPAFRLINSLTPGPYTFILKGTKEVPRMTLHAKKHTVGARIPDHKLARALLAENAAPLLSTSLIMPGQEEAMTDGWEVFDSIGHLVDVVIEGQAGTGVPSTVIDFTEDEPILIRAGAGDTEMFE